ncbi:ParB/RepB/Spo0J family partition protein [Burkholderia pyrrocinia]|uniref:ParB/RepB/Spo0J family partition protein n=1 Tax=Burkholderia pyrrocinia TaxID=60550 RepID=UPI001FC8D068|nr:pyridoxal phosphate biosynthetic protein PdxJ [Burkholderia pyrrocinia]
MDDRTQPFDLTAPIPTGNIKAAAAAAGATSADLWMVPYGQLHYDPADNIRPVDPEWVTHLTALIVENGYDKGSPLHCYARKVDGKDLLYVYKGQHRYLAAGKAIEAGKDVGKIPVVVRDAKTVNRAEMLIDGYLSNDSKRSSPLDLAAAVAELRDIHGMTLAAICTRLHITDQTIRDVGLLERAPVELHQMVREGAVAGTLAIEQIREHGADKALDRLQKGAAKAAASGKARVTKKHLDAAPTLSTSADDPIEAQAPTQTPTRATAPTKISEKQSKQLLQALQAVLHDSRFGTLTLGTRDAVHRALSPLIDMLDVPPAARTWPISTLNDSGVFGETDRIELPSAKKDSRDPLAVIKLAQVESNAWIYHTEYHDSQGGWTGPLKLFASTRVFHTRNQALRHGARALIDSLANQHRSSAHTRSVADKVIRWAERVVPKHDPDLTSALRDLPAAFEPNELADLRDRLGLDAMGCPRASWQETNK